MPISTPSNPRIAVALLLGGCCAPAVAGSAGQMSPPGTKPSISATSGAAAMEALAKARARAKPGREASGQTPTPALPAPSEKLRKRAFEAMRSRKADPRPEERARAARQAGEAQLARDRDEMSRRLAEALGLEAPATMAVAQAVTRAPAHAWVPVLFVSSSMPIATLRTYAGQLERARGVLAFRGMPGGLTRVGPMAKLSAQILRLDPGCEGPACTMRDVQLIIDPILFRQHGIARVPALGLLPGDPTKPYCEREEQGPASTKASHLVYGDAALFGMLETYARLGGKEEVRDAQTRLERR
ncbi:type-F conjugative transfer system pilin assembly protein TrbC [Sphingobium sp. EP60837]|uniref:type-F conjugative transfer system pilin assembly protein TrbC n=1 Tax=Sphingobium sp. EP60837 TaxID=1855519 RepID=UPI0009ECC8E7|nr:type-F conjugative transfer system pilin assembly protein TrbC [Sphingobium sp. EP60837]